MLFRSLIINSLLVLLLCSYGFVGASYAQTKISGKVYDGETNEPIPFANVIIWGTNIGTTTNIDGIYSLSFAAKGDSIAVSYVGYKLHKIAFKNGLTQTINFKLKSTNFALPEIVLVAKEGNRAHRLLDSIHIHKDENNWENLNYLQYEVYNKVEFDLNNITDKFMNRKLFKPFKFIFDNIDSTSENEKPYLPLFITESISDYYYRKTPKANKEVIKATKVSGVKNESASQFLGDMYQNTNIYHNYVGVFGKVFVSPIADFGLRHYKYYLMDSSLLDNQWCYKLLFIPKRKQENTFSGEMWVHDTTFAIKSIKADVAKDANINFVKGLTVTQQFIQLKSGNWVLEKDKLLVDFSLSDSIMGLYGRKSTSYKGFVVNNGQKDDFYTIVENIVVADDANEKDIDFWNQSRHDSLSTNEKAIYQMVDSIKKVPAFRNVADVITLFVTGHKTIGKFDLGPYYTLYSFNTVEGDRVRIGGKTNTKLSNRFQVNGFGAYGFRDKKFKYGAGFKYLMTAKPRQIIEIGYKYDMEQLGQSNNAFRNDNIIASVFRRNPFNKLTLIEQLSASYEREWFTGFSSKLGFRRRTVDPVGSFLSETASVDGFNKSITTSELGFFTRFAFKERFVSNGDLERLSLGTKYPIIKVSYWRGLKGWLDGDFDYHKINLNWEHWFRINPIGYLEYIIDAGKFFGDVPFPLLELHRGNETYTSDVYAFNMMNYYEFVSDQFVSLTLTHHFNGYILDRVPLFRKLKWRTVVEGKGVIGSLKDSQRELIAFPDGLFALGKPYFEGSMGIENIFKVIRLDLLRRFTYLDHQDIAKFGLRMGLYVNF